MREERRITVSQSFSMWDMDRELWSGARDRWKDADLETREAVWDRICDYVDGIEFCTGDVPSMTSINDLVWFDCDDLFFPEEEEEEEEEEEQ